MIRYVIRQSCARTFCPGSARARPDMLSLRPVSGPIRCAGVGGQAKTLAERTGRRARARSHGELLSDQLPVRRFVLMVNKQGQTRLAQYYEPMPHAERRALEGEIVRKCLSRSDAQVRPVATILLAFSTRDHRGVCYARCDCSLFEVRGPLSVAVLVR
jgi:hypothetical protein